MSASRRSFVRQTRPRLFEIQRRASHEPPRCPDSDCSDRKACCACRNSPACELYPQCCADRSQRRFSKSAGCARPLGSWLNDARVLVTALPVPQRSLFDLRWRFFVLPAKEERTARQPAKETGSVKTNEKARRPQSLASDRTSRMIDGPNSARLYQLRVWRATRGTLNWANLFLEFSAVRRIAGFGGRTVDGFKEASGVFGHARRLFKARGDWPLQLRRVRRDNRVWPFELWLNC